MTGELKHSRLGACPRGLVCLAFALVLAGAAHAQDGSEWNIGTQLRGAFPPDTGRAAPAPAVPGPTLPANTTVVPRAPGADATKATSAQVSLVALLTADGQRIDQGLVWRIYAETPGHKVPSKLLMTKREASPTVSLEPGEYTVNAAFGRADITRKITVAPGVAANEVCSISGPRQGSRRWRQAAGKHGRLRHLSGSATRFAGFWAVRPKIVNRLNAGIYRIVSKYGDANAMVEADVTVEAGKLTEATMAHSAARVTFKLVTRAGGEALPDTQWTVQTPDGQVVMQSVGALPTHILAPGTYSVMAKSGDRAFKRDFTLANGEVAQVEVLIE
jgi:hypothetical protein